MKYFLIFISFLLAVVFFLMFLLFTQSGNNIVKPYLEKVIKERLQQDVSVKAFTLKTDFIDLELAVSQNSKLILNGNFNLLSKSMDINYEVEATDLKSPYINIDGLLHVQGNIKGIVENFEVNGTGIAFDSNIDFITLIEKRKVKAIKLDAKKIKIESVLAFFKKPIYSKGIFDISIDAEPKTGNSFVGKGDIFIHYATLNNSLLERDFGIKLNNIISYRGTINSVIDGDNIQAKTEILSNVAKISSQNTQYNLKNDTFYSDYVVSIPELGLLEKSLQGSIKLDGNIQKTKDDFSFDINSKTLGGTIKAIVSNDTLKLDATDIKLPLLSEMLKQPKYSDGILQLSLDMRDTKEQSRDGDIRLYIKNGTLHVRELIESQKEDKINYILSLKSIIDKNIASINSTMVSDVLELEISNSKYNIADKVVKGAYTLSVADLNNLYFLTKRPLKGELEVVGNYKFDKQLYIDGNSDFLDAKTSFTFQDNFLHVKSDELSIAKVSDMLYYPKFFDSLASVTVDYNLTSEVGLIDINALNGKLVKSEFTDIILLASGFDLTSEVYKNSLFRGVVDKNKIDFSLLMNGLESYLKMPDGYLNLETNQIDSDFEIKIEHRDFQGNIKGDLESPNIKLSGSEYIKQKIDKAIERNLPEEWQDTAKELLKLFD